MRITRAFNALALIVAAVMPFILPEAYLYILGLAYIFAIMVISWDLMVGYTGQVNLGHTTFVGLGAYVAAILQTPIRAGLSLHPALAIITGGVVAAGVGLSIGIITLRLRGYYFSLVTAILPLVFMQTVFIWRELFGGEEGFAIENTMLTTTVEKYYFSLAVLVVSLVVMKKVVDSRIGLRFMALRDSEELAESLGINATKYKVLAFALSSFFAGIAGAMVVNYRVTVSPELYGVPLMLLIILSAVLGGLGTLYGPLAGAIVIYLAKNWWLGQIIRTLSLPINDDIVLYALLIAVGILMPEGLYHKVKVNKQK
ncbi:branched-chain amino acid ABC transporter permease [Archaeoglobus fulgidus]|jgi:branched-chain amino acid transport system permease protein|nr:branched-chain amino acid ABC transporter permease [Archaeoglobus fulgidus]AIG97043.1 ABC-type branched-chain amino acid transport system, permease component [Archaeoglobus fulgidus DSM 8774]KUJ94537.1 MAG: Branched-chain amino acid ABC transporter, permease protein (BraE-1) [Archaeoglobus fulgidus]KUK07611.1 MAG: Branched-chain amino acid ABC transporter, permease protein (BraE-1) [Archaeoglobus fulgidus]